MQKKPATCVATGCSSLAALAAGCALLFSPLRAEKRPSEVRAASADTRDDAGARAAFLAAAPVFFHPRCMNCHPSGDQPLQGDDSHPHTQNVRRGPLGNGVYGMKCSACHQQANTPGLHMPPGAVIWRLPPPKMPMVFQGETPRQLCEQLKDPKQNGGRTLAGIVEHVSNDKLVGWGWDPGEGRTLPPLSRAEFARELSTWVQKGAACPD
jgi:cytochrome c5